MKRVKNAMDCFSSAKEESHTGRDEISKLKEAKSFSVFDN